MTKNGEGLTVARVRRNGARARHARRKPARRKLSPVFITMMAIAVVIAIAATGSGAGAWNILGSPPGTSGSLGLGLGGTQLQIGTAPSTSSSSLDSGAGSALAVVSSVLAPFSVSLSSFLDALVPLASTAAAAPAPAPTPPPAASTPSGPVPDAPHSVSAAQSGTLPDLTVSWVDATGGSAATGAVVQLSQVIAGKASYLTQIACGSCSTSTFRDLSFDTMYEAAVFPTNANGIGPSAASPAVDLTTTCTVGACVGIDAASSIGPANHADAGIVDSLEPTGDDQADATALDMSMWRGIPSIAEGCCDWSDWDVATASGAKTTIVISDLWANANGGGQPPTPWSDWSAYESWVKSTVSELVASKKQINYWEVYNEPGGNDGYYDTAGYDSETPALLLQQFLVTYQGIKAVDPSAAIIGPSLAYWSDYPGQYGDDDHSFDMVTFVNFAVANNMKLAALSWHEELDNYGPNAEENSLYPATLEDHVAEARALIAARPSLGDPQIFINEYGMPEVQKIPGWDVAYLAALTDAGVNSADRSCWDDDCSDPDLDGLLYTNGTSPLAGYYVRQVYAAMSGNMVATTSSSDTVNALASYNSGTGTLTGLVGRGVGCSQNVEDCPSSWPYYETASAESVMVNITVPWSSGTAAVTETDISGDLPQLPASTPASSSSTYLITPNGSGGGTISVLIPSFADGDAYGLTVTQS